MKWAVVGSLGMLGKGLSEFLAQQGEEVESLNRNNLDIAEDFAVLVKRFYGCDLIANCVAYTNVDQAEKEREQAFFANALVPSLLAQIADSVGAKLIHISTDYVFDGQSVAPYKTDAPKNPQSAYGETKSIGEDLVLAFENSQIVRTSWLYGAQGNCFPKTIARKLLAGEVLKVVDDQIGSPTHTMDLAEFIYRIGKSESSEPIWHGVSSGSTSWFEFAQEIAVALDHLVPKANGQTVSSAAFEDQLTATGTDQSRTAALRPAYSVLLPSSIDGFVIPDWRESWSRASKTVLAELF